MNQKQALQTFGRSGNPMFSSKTFSDTIIDASIDRMTLQGTVNKVGISLLLVILSASYTWNLYYQGSSSVGSFMIGGMVIGFIIALVTIFKKTWAPITAPLYALAKGFALGGISASFESQFGGITIQAVTLTLATLFGLLVAYKTGIIKPDKNFMLMVFAGTFAIASLYLVNFIIFLINGSGFEFLSAQNTSLMSIGISLLIICIAALNLVLDFDYIEDGAEKGAPKYLEWYGAFSLMVTLIWLYLEILRLLAKIRGR